MRRILGRVRRDDGASTVEYAMTIVIAAAIAGVLLKIVSSTEVYNKLHDLVVGAIS